MVGIGSGTVLCAIMSIELVLVQSTGAVLVLKLLASKRKSLLSATG
jgi:hypothetical protein